MADQFGAALTGSSVLLTTALLVVLVPIVAAGRSHRSSTVSAVEESAV